MIEYRISKYNPQNRDINGVYQKNEWTSISDIGKKFDNGLLKKEEYLHVENNYIEFVLNLLENLNITDVKIEKQEPKKYAFDKIKVGDKLFSQILQENLRENYWCEFHCKNLYFWVGYDYYLHINSKRDIINNLMSLAKKYQLFVEQI